MPKSISKVTKNANLYIRINPETKDEAEKLFSSFGLTISDAVNVFLYQSLMVGGFPFDVRKPEYNAGVIEAMKEAEKISRDPNIKGVYSVKDLFKELDS